MGRRELVTDSGRRLTDDFGGFEDGELGHAVGAEGVEVVDRGGESGGLARGEQHVEEVGLVTRHRSSGPYRGWRADGCSCRCAR